MNDMIISENHEISNALREFLNSTLKEIMSVLNAECGSLFIFDCENKELVLDSFYNAGSQYPKGLRKAMGEGIVGKVIDIKQPILVKDIASDLRFKRNGYSHYKTNSFICIPLFTPRCLIGLISLADKSNGESFAEKDLEFAVSICKYACLVVESLNNSLRLRQERETISKQKSLLEKYASMGKLAAGVVHEVNNPLDGIIRYTNIILEQIGENSVTREYLLEVKKGLNRIANITKSLLEFAHQVNFHSTGGKRFVNLHELLDEAMMVFNDKLSDKIQVIRRYKESLGRISDLGLTHIFTNIIKNSLDAMPDGGALEISTNVTESMVEVRFKDTGAGMSSDVMGRIFEPFFTTKSIDKGTGLGLAICNEIISKYEGKIEVKSTLGQGSTFIVLIPRKHLENG